MRTRTILRGIPLIPACFAAAGAFGAFIIQYANKDSTPAALAVLTAKQTDTEHKLERLTTQFEEERRKSNALQQQNEHLQRQSENLVNEYAALSKERDSLREEVVSLNHQLQERDTVISQRGPASPAVQPHSVREVARHSRRHDDLAGADNGCCNRLMPVVVQQPSVPAAPAPMANPVKVSTAPQSMDIPFPFSLLAMPFLMFKSIVSPFPEPVSGVVGNPINS